MKRRTLLHGGSIRLPLLGALLVSSFLLSGCGLLAGESFEDKPPPPDTEAEAGGPPREASGARGMIAADGLAVIDVSMGGNRMCVVTAAHTILCDQNMAPPPSGTFDSVSVDTSHGACAIATDGSLRCWNASPTSTEQDSAPQVVVQSVSVGSSRSCAIQSNRILCWGRYAPPDYALEPLNQLSPVEIACGKDVCIRSSTGLVRCLSPSFETFHARSLSVSDTLACAVETATNRARCWLSSESPSEVLTPIPDVSFKSVTVGVLGVACGIRDDDTIQCWGASSTSQKPTRADRGESISSRVPPGKYEKVAVGYGSACAIRDDGTLACWGDDEFPPMLKVPEG